MDVHSQLKQIFRALGANATFPIGEDGLHFILSYDDLYECTVGPCDDAAAIEFSTPLCVAPIESEPMFDRALQLCLHGAGTDGAAIVLSRETPVLALTTRLPAQRLQPESLADALARFIAAARRVRRELVEDAGAPAVLPVPTATDSVTTLWA